MTCSSSTTSRAKRAWGAGFRPLVAFAALALTSFAGRAQEETGATLFAAGRQALARGDGIDAEVKLRAALDQGLPKESVAAWLGAAYLRQEDFARARHWLGPGAFSSESAAEGFRLLARLEQIDGNLPAAGAAYDRALAITPNDAVLWVEIGRLRYRGGEHLLAIEAANHALALDPRNVRALEFSGELVRDRVGLLASLPWFEAGLKQAPDDVPLLIQYAATLGELGRATDMLAATRRILKVDGSNPRAFYLQAVLAARAGKYELARGLLARTGGKLDDTPGALLLESVLELAAGNPQAGAELSERLLGLQPGNARAQQVLARAIFLSGQYRYLTLRFRDEITREDASPYLLTLVARGHEALGNRTRAGELLDRAAARQRASFRILPGGSVVGALMAQGRSQDALAAAERDLLSRPGSYEAQSLAGDVQLALGHPEAAQQLYAAAGSIRMSENLLVRRVQAYVGAGDAASAARMVRAYLGQHPRSRIALRLEAGAALAAGDLRRAEAILHYLARTGGDRDVQLLTDLALVQLQSGAAEQAVRSAEQAYRLQRASGVAAQALGLSYATRESRRADAAALLDKARQMLGDTALLAEARRRMDRSFQS
ncbi:tetratricopeptide repeat protein [Novosphingobium sp. RD2P27]|uniref:Tetratricopeptide repeat protein n=1 Tax=Novosphingobium kalidii TaxID=3230299 RepID=A0ABV2CZ41_9SPHN